MKLKLNDKIYFLYGRSITELTVDFIGTFLGEKAFAHSKSFDKSYENEFRKPLFFDDEGTTWFRKLGDAKKELRKRYVDCMIKKYDEDYWEAVGGEETNEIY